MCGPTEVLPDTSHSQVCEKTTHFLNPAKYKFHDTKGLLKPLKIEKFVISANSHTRLY